LIDLPVSLGAVRRLQKELAATERDERPLVVGGARELAAVLRRELLRAGGDQAAVREGDPGGAAVYVHVLAGGEADEVALRRARRARVPAVAVAAAGGFEGHAPVPFVRAYDVVRVPSGAGFPLEAIARVVARRLGEDGVRLAARVPVLRPAVCDRLILAFSRRNGLVAVAGSGPGADLPVLTGNQLRLVLRLAQAHGLAVGQERLPELAAVVGAGLGLRGAARELLDAVPLPGRVVKGAVAYTGTRALGEAARLRFAAEKATQPPA
jgi:uncharacterized protein (DUF697 family)